MKILETDCLLQGQLHVSVRERLLRIRELAHGGVANLHGVEKDGPNAYLVWDYVEGQSLDQWAEQRSARELGEGSDVLLLAREVVLAVDALHGLGIVHGALHGRNIIVEPGGGVRLIDLSPLLYTEASQDAAALLAMLRALAARSGLAGAALQQALVDITEHTPLRHWAARLGAAHRSADGAADRHDDRCPSRRRTLLAAAVAVVLAAGLAYGVRAMFTQPRSPRPMPPQAPEAALQPGSNQ